jgi:hypothetical protein
MTACKSDLDAWQLKSRQKLQGLSENLPVQFEPPYHLETYAPLPVPRISLKHQVISTDKNGRRRLQLYLEMPPHTPKAPGIDKMIAQYKNDFDIIWIFFRSNPKTTESEEWINEAGWFAPDIPKNQHYHDIPRARFIHDTYRQ